MTKENILKILKNTVSVIVIISLFIIIFYQNRDRNIFKRDNEESNPAFEEFADSKSGQSYMSAQVEPMGKNVLYLTTSSLKILDKDGEGETVPIALSEPMLHTEGNYAVCYSKNEHEAIVYNKQNECYTVLSDNKIIRAKVNKNGYLFLATEKEGYNCECRVYNRSGEAIFKWDISKSEFLDGDINNSNNAIAICVATATTEKLLGEVMLIDITRAEVLYKTAFDSRLLFSLDFNKNDTFTAFGNKSLVYFNAEGSKKWEYEFGSKTLSAAKCDDPDMIVLAFSAQGSGIKGNSTDVKVLNRLGKVMSEKTFDSVADDISVGENTIALAFGKSIYVTDSDLKIRKEVKADSSIKKIALYSDNEHLFVLGNSGGKILD